jgi:integrase/recombinase XerD
MLRVANKEGDSVRVSTGTTSEPLAREVKKMLRELKQNREWKILGGIVAKQVKLPDVFDAYQSDNLESITATLDDIDIEPLVAEWAKHANAKYVTQVRRLIAEGQRFPASRFRRRTISVFLAGLPVSGSTRNRYKAALSVFAKWLVEREVIETNPVRDVKSAKPNPARMVWLSWKQARQLVAALPKPYRALEALMAGTGMEWSAIANTKRSDVDVETRKIHAQGTKNTHRNRVVKVTEDWAWNEFYPHLKTLHPNSPLFEVSQDYALDVHQAASKALGLEASTLHDWRHTYAVNWLKAGGKAAPLKRQLGHAPNSTVVERVYGVWIVDDADYEVPRRRHG